jgi:hypothetical protein
MNIGEQEEPIEVPLPVVPDELPEHEAWPENAPSEPVPAGRSE